MSLTLTQTPLKQCCCCSLCSQASLCRALLPASALCLAFSFALGIYCLVGLDFMGLVCGAMLPVLNDMRKQGERAVCALLVRYFCK